MNKPFVLHYSDRRKVMPLLPKDAKVISERHGFYLIAHITEFDLTAAIKHFNGVALVGICEQNDQLNEDIAPFKIDQALPKDKACAKQSCVA